MSFWELSPSHLKVKRLLANTLHHGHPLKKNWATHEIVETLLEKGTRDEADQVLQFSTEEDPSNKDNSFFFVRKFSFIVIW